MMSLSSLNWGLLSTARINRRLIPAIRATERAALQAVASRDPARAEAYAAQWGIPRAHGTYESLLNDPDIDVVYVSLPNSLHAEWTVRACQAGKHVLCEKPLALSVSECDQIIAASEQAGVVVAEAVMYLHHPLLQTARRMLQEGVAGQIRLVRGAFSLFLDRIADVRWVPELGGGCLWDVGSYPVSFIRWIAGEPGEAFGWQTPSNTGVDATFAGLLRCKDGVLGVFDCGFRHQFRTHAEVVGTEGVLTIEHPFIISPKSRILLQQGSGEAQEITSPEPDAYRCEVEALTAAILDGRPLPVSLHKSRANVATLVALYESAHQGRPQVLPEL